MKILKKIKSKAYKSIKNDMSVQNKLHDACKLQLINTIMTCEQFVPFTSL